ncbi:MAG: hypothetical protein QXS32_09025 [Candidatus Nezhaarchaeales archaeon]
MFVLDKAKIKPRNYQLLYVDFSVYDGRPIYVVGDYLELVEAKDVTDLSNILIKFNEGEFIPLSSCTPANTPFYSLQLMNLEGRKGRITLLIGQEFFRVSTQSVTLLRDLIGLAKTSDVISVRDRLPSSLTAAGNFRVALVETTIKQPIEVRDHWSESVVLLPSAARTASGSTADINVGRFLYAEVCVDVTAVSGTSPVLNVYVEGKDRYTGKYKTLLSFENISSVQTLWGTITMLAFTLVRVRWTISGTSPSFTFSVSMEGKS